MGIPGLLPKIKEHMPRVPLSSLRGARAGVDGYSWLYKAASVFCVGLYENPDDPDLVMRYTRFCIGKCKVLVQHGVQLYFVFDGAEHPMKAGTARKRREKKEEAKRKIDELLQRGRIREARALMGRCVKVDGKMVANLVSALDSLGISHIFAPYEADPQLAYLQREAYIDYIITEDSDLVAYGADMILFKLDAQKGAELFDRKRILRACSPEVRCLLLRTKEVAALAGCDYTEGIKNVGVTTAVKLLVQNLTLEACISHLEKKTGLLPSVAETCLRAAYTFSYHVVKNPETDERRHLSDPESSPDDSMDFAFFEDSSFVGSLQDPLETLHPSPASVHRPCSMFSSRDLLP